MKHDFLDSFSKNIWVSNYNNIRSDGSRDPRGRRDGQIETKELTVA